MLQLTGTKAAVEEQILWSLMGKGPTDVLELIAFTAHHGILRNGAFMLDRRSTLIEQEMLEDVMCVGSHSYMRSHKCTGAQYRPVPVQGIVGWLLLRPRSIAVVVVTWDNIQAV